MKRINPNAKFMDDFDPGPRKLPIIVYIRRSTPGQMTKSVQSLIQQDKMLHYRILKYGWTEELIIPVSVDDGVSGQKLITDREGLARVYRDIESGRVGAIACYDASRIWRDVTGQYSSEFISMLQRNMVPLVTYEHVFIPSGDIYNDPEMDLLRKEFEASASYIKHFYNKVIPAKELAIKYGHSFSGGACALGYYIVGNRGERRFVEYPPHSKYVKHIFRRFRELGCSPAKLWQEVRKLRIPDFEPGIEKPHLALHFDGEEYRINSYGGMLSILVNPIYIGILTYTETKKGPDNKPLRDEQGKILKETMIISRDEVPPLVSKDDFLLAYNLLADYTLEGEVNEQRRAKRASRVYAAHRITAGGWKTDRLAVKIDVIDGELREAMKVLLMTLEDRKRRGLEDTLYSSLSAMHEEKEERIMSLDKEVESTIKGIRRARTAWTSAINAAWPQKKIDELALVVKKLGSDKEELEAKIERMQHEEAELAESKTLIMDALDRFEAMPFERQHRFMKLMVKRANMSELSPHIIRLDILLNDPLACTLTGYIFRRMGSKEVWSEEELTILRDLYADADRAILERKLPTRSWNNITVQASFMGLRRYTRANTSELDELVSCADVQVMRKVGMRGKQTLWKLVGARDISVMEADDFLRVESVTTPEERNMHIEPLPGETTFDILEKAIQKWDVIQARLDAIESDNDFIAFS